MKKKIEASSTKPATIKEIAERAKVSTATVSRALSYAPYVSDGTRERVLQASSELGYKPNHAARCLRSNESKVVGIFIPDMVDDFFFHICNSAMEELERFGYMPVLAFTRDDAEREKRIVQYAVSRKFDGLIMCGCNAAKDNDYLKEVIEEHKIPIVFLSGYLQGLHAPSVSVDNASAVHELTVHLIENSYKKIAYIKKPSYMKYANQCHNGYLQAMADKGLIPRTYECSNLTIESGRLMADTIINDLEEVDVVVACDDLVAFGLMSELRNRGINIPADIAISGIGGSLMSTIVSPKLTTIDYPKEQIGHELAGILLERMHKRKIANDHITVKPVVQYRDSTERN